MNEVDPSELSKRERKAFFKEQEQHEQEKKKRIATIARWSIVVGIVGGVLGGVGWWVKKEAYRPVLGEAVVDLGRNHIPQSEWEKFRYNSNPPTSGPHDAEWIRAGIYDAPFGDGYLVHSLEHGYVIISYNCTKLGEKRKAKSEKLFAVYAHHEEESETSASPSGELTGEAWKNKECQTLKNQLADVAKGKGLKKLIVVPRPNLDAAIAITAWGRIDTFSEFDRDRIVRFIDSYRDRGPEKTME